MGGDVLEVWARWSWKLAENSRVGEAVAARVVAAVLRHRGGMGNQRQKVRRKGASYVDGVTTL